GPAAMDQAECRVPWLGAYRKFSVFLAPTKPGAASNLRGNRGFFPSLRLLRTIQEFVLGRFRTFVASSQMVVVPRARRHSGWLLFRLAASRDETGRGGGAPPEINDRCDCTGPGHGRDSRAGRFPRLPQWAWDRAALQYRHCPQSRRWSDYQGRVS